jgi:hypothetical protein
MGPSYLIKYDPIEIIKDQLAQIPVHKVQLHSAQNLAHMIRVHNLMYAAHKIQVHSTKNILGMINPIGAY